MSSFRSTSSSSHLSRLASDSVETDLAQKSATSSHESNQKEMLRIDPMSPPVSPRSHALTPKSRKGSTLGLASLEEVRIFLKEAYDQLNVIPPKKLRNLRYGEELRELLGRVESELDVHAERIDAHLDSPGVVASITKLRSSVSKAQPLIVR